MELHLDPVETRVLGSLMEKDITTPEYYPLTLNALLAACNQKSNREPVMELDEAPCAGPCVCWRKRDWQEWREPRDGWLALNIAWARL